MNRVKFLFFIYSIICWHSVLPLSSQNRTLRLVAANDCGVPGAQPFLVKGENYTLPSGFSGSKAAQTCNFGNTVIYAFNQLDIQADYQLEVAYLADHERHQHIVADGNEIQSRIVLEPGKEQRYRIDLPKKAYAYGQLILVFEKIGKGDNVLVSEVNLYSTQSTPPVPFEGSKKQALMQAQTFTVDTNVDVEKILPLYTVMPQHVQHVYQPYLSLNGTWSFCSRISADFHQQKISDEWKPIIVPGEWYMQGFQVDSAKFGGYRKTFTIPEDWKGNRIKARFDGVSSECQIYLNGEKIGYHLGGMTAFELDLTRYLKSGNNELALAVRNESIADMLGSLTQYAAHPLGGITRNVTLFTVPEIHISDIRIKTDLNEQYENALLNVRTAIVNTTKHIQKNLTVRITIDGLPNVIEKNIPSLAPGETRIEILSDSIFHPFLWNNEQPNLYTLKMELESDSGQLETIEKKFGFRKIEIYKNEILVNGQAIKLRGVCRHESHPLTGRVIDDGLQQQDIELYRNANCNFIRTSHYPPAEVFLDMCDKMGMFVEVEAPICWIGHHANKNWERQNYQDSSYYSYVLQANMETIHLYRNHPSVLFWSMANESYWNSQFAQIQEYVIKADPTRPHTFHDQAYGGFNNQGSTAPIANIHYPGPDGYKTAVQSDRPIIYGEYCHLNVYNRRELVTDPGIRSDWALALAPTWENMYRTPGILGGSIWSGIDDIFQLPNGEAVGYGPWGPIDGWRRPKPEYWDMKKIYSPIRLLTTTLTPASELQVEIENRYTYLNTDQLKITYRYGSEHGTVSASIAPKEKGILQIPISQPEIARELYLSFTDPRGFIADEYLIPVGQQTQNDLSDLIRQPTSLKTTRNSFHIIGKNFSCKINRTTGQIVSLQKKGETMLIGGPQLMVLPLTGDGCYPNHNAHIPIFNDLCSNWETTRVEAQKNKNDVKIIVEGKYKEFTGGYTLTINANGELHVQYRFNAQEPVNPRQWGLVFETPKNYNKTFWRRKSLWSVYPKNHIGRPVGEAELFYPGSFHHKESGLKPTQTWEQDCNEMGSNDFRATRRNIWYAGLMNSVGNRITVHSNGKQHWRSWLEQDRIRFLIADFVTAGNEMFLEGYYAPYRRPIQKGDSISGTIILRTE